MEKWQIVQSIYKKVITKCPVGTCKSKFTKNPLTAFSCRCLPEARMVISDTHGKDVLNSTYLVSKKYLTAIATTAAQNIRYLNFNSENERKNAWESYLTKFARFCIAMDESTKLAPYMDDYREPWTDERFVEFFGLTEDEWKVIDETIK